MTQQEEREQQEKCDKFLMAMKRRFPTIIGIVSLGSETSKAMREATQEYRKQALIRKAARRT